MGVVGYRCRTFLRVGPTRLVWGTRLRVELGRGVAVTLPLPPSRDGVATRSFVQVCVTITTDVRTPGRLPTQVVPTLGAGPHDKKLPSHVRPTGEGDPPRPHPSETVELFEVGLDQVSEESANTYPGTPPRFTCFRDRTRFWWIQTPTSHKLSYPWDYSWDADTSDPSPC